MKRFLALLLICSCLVGLCACDKNEDVYTPLIQKVDIVTTVYPLGELVDFFTDGSTSHVSLYADGRSFVDFEPTSKDFLQINSSKLFIYCGDEVDAWVQENRSEFVNTVTLVNAAEGVAYIGSGDAIDYNIWNSSTNLNIIIGNIVDALGEYDEDAAFDISMKAMTLQMSVNSWEFELGFLGSFLSVDKVAYLGAFTYSYVMSTLTGVSYITAIEGCNPRSPTAAEVNAFVDAVVAADLDYFLYDEYVSAAVVADVAARTGAQGLAVYSGRSAILTDTDELSIVAQINQFVTEVKIALEA